MRERDELDAFMMFLRAMSGESNVIEKTEQEGNERAARNTQVAREMNPSQEVWEKLGFKFTEIPGDDVLYSADLPEGWTMRTTSLYGSEIVDQNGNVRASMFYKASFYDRTAYMSLTARYGVRTDYRTVEEGEISEIYFGNENEKLFVAGVVIKNNDMTDEERKAKREEERELSIKAETYANEYYPDYQDVTAYWDDEPAKKKGLQ